MPTDVPNNLAYEFAFDFALATAAARASSAAAAESKVTGITPPSCNESPPALTTASIIVPAADALRTKTSKVCDAR